MNLMDLSKLDIKDLQKINYTQLGKDLTKRPDFIIIIASILLSLFLSIHFFSKNQKLANTLKLEVKTLEDKVAVIETYNKTKGDLAAFQDAISEPLSEEELINIISDFAFKRNLQIKSLTPGQDKESTYHNLISIHVRIESSDFKNMWLFIHDIESSKTALRVDDWNGSMEATTNSRTSRRQSKTNTEKKIEFQIKISAVNYIDV
ncbi:MAG: hypothetical protein KAR05_05155 [Candidatus Omnitrophica bacterium]|nr:hypothetical protein [Candidatus Omnitrophota bacterium]